jgi:hypothetical protein
MVSGRFVCLGALVLGFAAASGALAQVAPYIQADPAAVTKAFGKQTADKIFSDAYTPVRQRAVLQSVKSIPGYDCPADPPITLGLLNPYPINPGTVSWIEHYMVMCKPPTQRSFLMILDKDQLRTVAMLPGESAADPLLQRDAMQGALAALIPATPKDCLHTVATDTSSQARRRTGVTPGSNVGPRPLRKKAALDADVHALAEWRTDWSTTLAK